MKAAMSEVMRNQRGKFAALVLWFLVVFVVPMIFLLPSVRGIISAVPTAFVAPEDDIVFKQFISLLQDGQYKTAHAMMSKEAQDAIPEESLRSIAPFLKDTTDRVELVGARFNTTKVGRIISWGGSGTSSESEKSPNSTTVYEVSYEVQNNDPKYTHALITMSGIKKDGKLEIQAFHADLRDYSVKDQSAPDVRSNIIWMLLAIVIPLFIGYTAFNYLSSAANPRWVLLLVILLLNLYVYVAGDVVNFKFGFYSFASQTPYGSWAFITPVPLGAIYYWITRKKYLKPSVATS